MGDSRKKRRIFLCGLPGSGKTETGRVLAGLLGWGFVDIDEAIRDVSGKSIPHIFANFGEARFRDMEIEMLRHFSSRDEDIVVSLGGGTLESEGAWELIRGENFVIVWLKVAPGVAASRLEDAGSIDMHPLLEGLRGEKLYHRLDELNEKRLIYFGKSDFVIETDCRGADDVARGIVEYISCR